MHWYTDPKYPQRQIGWIEPGHAYAQPTRQIGVQETRSNGKVYRYVLVCNLTDAMILEQNGLSPQPNLKPEQLLGFLLNLYDLRSSGIETSS